MTRKPFFLGDRSITLSAIACFAGLGSFLAWATFVPLAEGVTVDGQIVVEDKRKVIQHLEGGIVRTLHVREGHSVEAGDVLMELEDLRARAERDQTGQALVSLLASLDRLKALKANQEGITFSSPARYNVAAIIVGEAQGQAASLFDQQRESFRTELAVIDARKSAFLARAQAQKRQEMSILKSISFLTDEIANKRPLLEARDIRIDEIQRLERELASLEGDLSRVQADRQQALAEAAEASERRAQAVSQFREKTANDLLEVQSDFLAREEQFRAAQNVLERTVIVAPQSGTVMNMTVTTIGGVVRSSEPIMEIVPDTAQLVAAVEIRPTDRDSIHRGMAVQARLTAYKDWYAPHVTGRVTDVSADLKTSPDGSYDYYEAFITLDAADVMSESPVDVIPGMPIQAFVDAGTSRTFAHYLLEPILGVLQRGVGRG